MEISLDRVKIHEVSQISPSSSSSSTTTSFSLPLTFFDTFWLKFHPVERLFFYQFTRLTPHVFNSVILPKLKQSLSVTLSHYLPLAGKLMWPQNVPKPAVYYSPNDYDSVSLTVAESKADFNRLSGKEIQQVIDFRPLTPELSISDDKADIISLQITLFPDEGFSIGISSHHAILDGRSSTMFIKSWAYICKQEDPDSMLLSLPQEFTPCFDRTLIKDPSGLDMLYLNNYRFTSNTNTRSLNILPHEIDFSNLVRGIYELTREDIRKLREKLLSQNESNRRLHLSSFVLTCAYVLVCMVKAKGGEGDSNRDVVFGFTADYRARLDPPVPINYFGNCLGAHAVFGKASDLMDQHGVSFVAQKLSGVIKGFQSRVLHEGVAEGRLFKLMGDLVKSGAQSVGVAGSNRFEIYGSDFGWGRPKKVEVVSVDRTGMISLAESGDGGGGVEVGVLLEKHEMETFASHFVHGLKNL